MSDSSFAGGFGAVLASVAEREPQAATFKEAVKVLVLRHITVEGLDVLIKHHLFAKGIRAEVEFGGYGSIGQDVLSPDGPVARTDPDIIVLALSLEDLDSAYGAPGWRCDAARNEVDDLLELLLSKTRAIVAVHNFIPPLWPEGGLVLDRQGHDVTAQVQSLNLHIVNAVRERAPRLVLMDWERSLRQLGAAAALDERGRCLWRAPFRHAFLNVWAEQLSRVATALKGRTKKVLVLDCDNTLWGGVVGEDGLDGIQLDREHHPGRTFFDFHTTVLHLAERGVLVTLCSKNNEADIFEVLDKHAACRVKRSHLAGWRINWNDKASNIAELAEELNLGLDAFVLVDDNPVECELVRQLLPQVTVLQVPKKLHELPPLLYQGGLFDTLQITAEDRKRVQLYQGESQRKSARAAFGDLDEYLKSMQTVAVIHRAGTSEISRVAQLTQKTNQFNLTTRRYAESEVAALAADPDAAVYTLSARDRFGDLGLVGVLIVRFEGTVGRIDSFLMSCRALGRRLELAMIEHCLQDMHAQRPVDTWQAEYITTTKNAQVADYWPRMGFTAAGMVDGCERFVCAATAVAERAPTFVTIEPG